MQVPVEAGVELALLGYVEQVDPMASVLSVIPGTHYFGLHVAAGPRKLAWDVRADHRACIKSTLRHLPDVLSDC